MGETVAKADAGQVGKILHAHRQWLDNGRNGGAPQPRTDFSGMDLSGATLDYADLSQCRFVGAKLTRASLVGARLGGAALANADLSRANLAGANLERADLENARVSRANFDGAALTGANLRGVRGLQRARGLESVAAPARAGDLDVLHLDCCRRSFLQRRLGWEQLRIARRLQVVALAALVGLPVLVYALESYNDEIETIRSWARVHGGGIADMLRAWLHPLVLPPQSMVFFLSALVLAAGTTIYSLACPARIQEFSREQWCSQLGRSLLHYWPLSWRYPGLRLVCALCCAIGTAGMLWILACMLVHAAIYIFSCISFSLV